MKTSGISPVSGSLQEFLNYTFSEFSFFPGYPRLDPVSWDARMAQKQPGCYILPTAEPSNAGEDISSSTISPRFIFSTALFQIVV